MDQRKSKRNSSGKRLKINTTFDRISALPDSILGVILSLLPTKNAVATSILSKRWEFMWRTVHNLDFCQERDWDLTEEQMEEENRKFVGFVNHVLLYLDAGMLSNFRLVWEGNCIESNVISWIQFAITRNTHNISLTLEFDFLVMTLPVSAFSSDSLRSLNLGGFICISATSVFSFPRLESLHLFQVNFQSQEALDKIIKGCPVLIYLKLDLHPDYEEEFRFIISSTSLKRLELDLGCGDRHLKVDASSLEHLKIDVLGYVYLNFVQNKLTSLVEADLSFHINCHDEYYPEADVSNPNPRGNAVAALDYVKILSLNEHVIQDFSFTAKSSSTRFTRLVKFKASITSDCWSSLLELIQRSNSLEALTIYKIPLDDETEIDHSNWIATAVEVPRCLSTSLKDVYYNGYNGLEDEREMIRYMLKYGNVLEDMHIRISRDRRSDGEQLKLVQEICEFPRKSALCKVRFSVEPSRGFQQLS